MLRRDFIDRRVGRAALASPAQLVDLVLHGVVRELDALGAHRAFERDAIEDRLLALRQIQRGIDDQRAVCRRRAGLAHKPQQLAEVRRTGS